MLLAHTVAAAQESRLGRCDFNVLGAGSPDEFLAFDRDFRHAIKENDAAKLWLLVDRPLRVNFGAGDTIGIQSAASLQQRLDEIFTPKVVGAVLGQRPGDPWCNYRGLTYGHGTVWVTHGEAGFVVFAINASQESPTARPWTPLFTCRTNAARWIVDEDRSGLLRLRGWKPSNPLEHMPDWLVLSGESTIDGRGPCAHRIWAFRDGERQVQLGTGGCHAASNPPPDRSSGGIGFDPPLAGTTHEHCY